MTSRRHLAFLTVGLALLLMTPLTAMAEPVALTVTSGISVQQTDNQPCLIGDPSCHNPDSFAYTLIPSGHQDLMLSSPTYTVDQLRAIVGGDSFTVGVDLNQARGDDGGTNDLQSFTMSVNDTLFFSTAAPVTLRTVSPEGFSDAVISGFNLAGLSGTDRLTFTTTLSGDTGGREQFFLSAVNPSGPNVPPNVASAGAGDTAPVPEPASMVLIATGLAGAYAARRRQQS